MFMFILSVRVLFAVLSQSWYVPDETWQSVEVAHKLVFGTGYETWEWWVKIRSSLYPLILAIPLTLLRITGLDSQTAVVLAPKIFQAFVTSCCEHLLIRSVKPRLQDWMSTLVIFSWHSMYSGSRTLINTVEYCVACVVLGLHLKNKQGEIMCTRLDYLPLVALGFMLRPTLALVLGPLCLLDLVSVLRYGSYRSVVKYVCLSVCVVVCCIAVDSMYFNSLTITPLNFFMVNVYNNLGVNYGTHPWHWYLTSCLTCLLGPLLVPLLLGTFTSPLTLTLPFVFNLICLSLLSHKEMRFIQSSLPFCFFVIASHLSSYKQIHQRMLKIVFLVTNTALCLYLSLVHQRGVVDAALYFGNTGHTLSTKGYDSNLMILMPCHSTPFYSHVHTNFSMRFLECTPDLESKVGYREEADQFYSDPQKWLTAQFTQNLPHFIMYFDVLQPEIEKFLEGYKTCATFFHSMLPEGRVGAQVILAVRSDLATPACQDTPGGGSAGLLNTALNFLL